VTRRSSGHRLVAVAIGLAIGMITVAAGQVEATNPHPISRWGRTQRRSSRCGRADRSAERGERAIGDFLGGLTEGRNGATPRRSGA
jgi:hypothetical protein